MNDEKNINGANAAKGGLMDDLINSEEYLEQFDLLYVDELIGFIKNNCTREVREQIRRHNSRRCGACETGNPIIYDYRYKTEYLGINVFINFSKNMYKIEEASVGNLRSLLCDELDEFYDSPNMLIRALSARTKNFFNNNLRFIGFCDTVTDPVTNEYIFESSEFKHNIETIYDYINSNCRDCVNVIISNSKIQIDKSKINQDIKVAYVLGKNPKIDEGLRINSKVIRVDELV